MSEKKIKQGDIEVNNTDEFEKLEDLVKDPSLNKPSKEETLGAQKDFEKAAKNFTVKMYKIGEVKEAQEFNDFILHFINNRFFWQKEAWMGTIKLAEELKASEIIFKGNKKKGIEIGYQALEFVFFALSNPGGIGLQAAIDFESENEIFVRVIKAIGDQLEEARKTLKEVQFLQEKWGAFSQGFYLDVEPAGEEKLPDGVEEEPVEENKIDK
jgi:hypothetical protein